MRVTRFRPLVLLWTLAICAVAVAVSGWWSILWIALAQIDVDWRRP